MNVKLIAATPEPERTIIYIARVSNPANQDNPNISKLIRYLINNKHWSPFEHAFLTFEIKTSMSIAEQMLRHRSFSFQKFSGRYSELNSFEPIELRLQADKNRQSSTDVISTLKLKEYGNLEATAVINALIVSASHLYRTLLDHGVAKEVARLVLPASTQTTFYMTGSIRSWIHYIAIRAEEHTQKEHRLIAEAIKKEFIKLLPITSKALGWTE